MSQISHIRFSDIKEARRYDAEYFKPEYLEINNNLKRLHSKNLDNYCLFIKKGIFDISPTKYRKSGIPFLRVSNTKSFFINDEDMVYLDEEAHKENNKTELKRGDIILSKVGTIGDAVINFDYERVNFSQNNIGIKIKQNEINSAYVIAFFNSKYGRKQIEKQQSGQVQEKIVLDDIKFLKIPRLPNEKVIANQVIQAHQKQSLSEQLYREAEELLLKELGLLNYEVEHTLSFSTTKKAIQEASRYDAEYFQPKYEDIIKKIEKYEGGFELAGEMVKWKKGVEVGTEAYSETGKDFIRVSDFSPHGISESNKKISNQDFENLSMNFQPRQGEILFTKDGTIGISYVLKENINGVLSGAFLRLILKEEYKDFEKECLSLIFNSILCRMQVKKLSGGALISHLKPSDFGTFKIPLIKPSTQKQIAEKIQESHKLRKESKNLLEEAKRKVEEEIER